MVMNQWKVWIEAFKKNILVDGYPNSMNENKKYFDYDLVSMAKNH